MSEKDFLAADPALAVGTRHVRGFLQGVVRLAAEIRFAAPADTREALYLAVDGLSEQALVDIQLPEQEVRHILAHRHHTFEQMYGLDGLLAAGRRAVDGLADSLLCFDSEVVKCHKFNYLLFRP